MPIAGFFRYFFWSILSIIGSLLITAFLALYFIDADRLRVPLNHLLSKYSTLPITVGKLSWKTSPALGISAETARIVIKDQPINIQALALYPDLKTLLIHRKAQGTLKADTLQYKTISLGNLSCEPSFESEKILFNCIAKNYSVTNDLGLELKGTHALPFTISSTGRLSLGIPKIGKIREKVRINGI